MNFIAFLSIVFLLMLLGLAPFFIMALRAPKEKLYRDRRSLPPESGPAHRHWLNTVSRMLVMRPWPYKDLYNPLNRLYWPDEQAANRAERRRQRRRKSYR